MTAQPTEDDLLIAALKASPDFVTVRDSDHLWELLGMDDDDDAIEAPGEEPSLDAHSMSFTH